MVDSHPSGTSFVHSNTRNITDKNGYKFVQEIPCFYKKLYNSQSSHNPGVFQEESPVLFTVANGRGATVEPVVKRSLTFTQSDWRQIGVCGVIQLRLGKGFYLAVGKVCWTNIFRQLFDCLWEQVHDHEKVREGRKWIATFDCRNILSEWFAGSSFVCLIRSSQNDIKD